MWEVAKNSPQLLGWLCESQGSSLGKNTFFFPLLEPQTQTFITSRREAEGPEYHLAAPNGLEPIQATEAWGTAGQEERWTGSTQESQSGGADWLRVHQTLREPAVRTETMSEGEKKALELGRRQTVPSQTLHGRCGEGEASPVFHACRARGYEAHPIRREYSFSSQARIQLQTPERRAFSRGGWFIPGHLP